MHNSCLSQNAKYIYKCNNNNYNTITVIFA